MQLKKLFKNEYTEGTAYVSIIFVVLFWGTMPLYIDLLLQYFSATVYSALYSTFSVIFLFIICRKSLKHINKDYLKVAIPTGIFLATAELFQKIGLPYTTPSNYAFLENLSCLPVPFLVFFFTKQKPSFLTIFSCVLCLVSAFILSGISFNNLTIGIGDLLCAIAGLLFGFNIAGTGVFAKKLKASLYILVQLCVCMVVNWLSVIFVPMINVNGAPLDEFKFSFMPIPLLCVMALALLSGVICWILRTKAMTKISPTAVAVIMPFSAVVASVASVIFGLESITLNLIIGGTLCLIASLLSGLASNMESKRELQKEINKQISQ